MKAEQSILFIANNKRPIVRFRGELIQMYLNAGFEVHIVTLQDMHDFSFQKEEWHDKVHWYQQDMNTYKPGPFQLIRSIRFLRRLVSKIQPDIILSQNPGAILISRLTLLGRNKHIFWAVLFEGRGRAFKHSLNLVWRSVFSRANITFFLNEADIQVLRDLGVLKKANVVLVKGIGVDLDRYKLAPMPQKSPVNVLMISRLVSDKGVMEYAQAAAKLQADGLEVALTLIGENSSGRGSISPEELQQNANDALTILPEQKDVRPFYQECQVLCLPSRNEGLPTVVMEAAAMGRAAILSSDETSHTALPDGARWVAKFGDVESLCHQIRDACDHAKAYQRGSNAHSFAQKYFSRADRSREIYEKIKENQLVQ